MSIGACPNILLRMKPSPHTREALPGPHSRGSQEHVGTPLGPVSYRLVAIIMELGSGSSGLWRASSLATLRIALTTVHAPKIIQSLRLLPLCGNGGRSLDVACMEMSHHPESCLRCGARRVRDISGHSAGEPLECCVHCRFELLRMLRPPAGLRPLPTVIYCRPTRQALWHTRGAHGAPCICDRPIA